MSGHFRRICRSKNINKKQVAETEDKNEGKFGHVRLIKRVERKLQKKAIPPDNITYYIRGNNEANKIAHCKSSAAKHQTKGGDLPHTVQIKYKDRLWSVERCPFMFGYRQIFTPLTLEKCSYALEHLYGSGRLIWLLNAYTALEHLYGS